MFNRLELPRLPFSTNGHAKPATVKAAAQLDPSRFWLPGNFGDSWSQIAGGDVASSLRGRQAFATAALCYICIQYRTTKVAEAPLRVVETSSDDSGSVRTLFRHPLASILQSPNPDQGMRRLLTRTQIYLDTTGRALWVVSRDAAGRPARMYVWSGDQFTSEATADRLYGRFFVSSSAGRMELKPADVVMFQYENPLDEQKGLAPLDAAIAHLQLSQELAFRVRLLLRNAAAPGGIYSVDKDRHLTDAEYNRVIDQINRGTAGVQTGRTMVLEGGGKFEKTAMTLRELALGDLWRENEAIVCAVFKVPASMVGVTVGLENAPWSQIATAKRSFYDETIIPLWGAYQEEITRQLLRPLDANPSHSVQFDLANIRPLQIDMVANSQIIANVSRIWTLNERRAYTDAPPSDDPRANEIPELTEPSGAAEPSAPATPAADEPARGGE